MKKIISFFLAILFVVNIVPIRAEAATTPKKVDDTILEERVALLRNFINNNSHGYKYFTSNGSSCDSKDGGHPSRGHCKYCITTNIIKSNWIKEDLGLIPDSEGLLPYPRWASPEEAAKYGKEGTLPAPAYSCVGFTMIAHWFLYAQKSTDNVAATHIATINLSKSDAKTQLDKYAKLGDMLVFRTSISTDTYEHAAIYTEHNSSSIIVIDSNWGGSSGPTCKMQEHPIPYSTYKYVEISRATTYTEVTHSYDKYGYCSHCKKYYEEINKVTSIEGTATKISFSKFYIKAHPYTGESGVNQDELKADECKVIGKIENHFGKTWYKVSYTIKGSSKTGWIDEDNYKITINNTINIELKMSTDRIPKGKSVWANSPSETYNWYGKVSSSNEVSKITSVTFEILKSDGTLTASTNRITKKPNAVSYVVKTNDDTMQFSKLAVGDYILSLSATDENGNTANKKYNFSVYSNETPKISVTGVNISQMGIIVPKGQTMALTATVSPSDATNKAVTWSSSNTSVATVSTSGVVTGVSAGTAVITVTTKDGSYKDTCSVTVNETTCLVRLDEVVSYRDYYVTSGETFTIPNEIPERTGYVFNYWIIEEMDDNGLTTTYYHQPGDSILITHDTIITAVWEEEKIISYNVYFDSNGGTGGPGHALTDGTEFIVPIEIPIREDWLFLYWMDDYGIYEPGQTYIINEDKELVAVWAPNWVPEITVGNVSGEPGKIVGVPIHIAKNVKSPSRLSFDVYCAGAEFINFERTTSSMPSYGILGIAYFKIYDDSKIGEVHDVIFTLYEWTIDGAYGLSDIVKITNGTITIESENLFIPGDCNGDGVINARDSQRLYEHIVGKNPFVKDSDEYKAADVNGDGIINARDSQRLYEHIVGKDPLD